MKIEYVIQTLKNYRLVRSGKLIARPAKKEVSEAIGFAVSTLESIANNKSNTKWKSINDELPKDGQKIIVWQQNISDPEWTRWIE